MIRGAYSEKVEFQDGSSAESLGCWAISASEDLQQFRLSTAPAESLELGDSDTLEVGDRVVAIGSPHGLQNTISDGLVSALRDGQIQTSAPISPGSSGGPFFNQRGQVIGLLFQDSGTRRIFNFVVPITWRSPTSWIRR